MSFSRDSLRSRPALSLLATLFLAAGATTFLACGGDDDDDTGTTGSKLGASCDKAGPTGDSQETLTVGGAQRSYYVHIPPEAATKTVALILAFHGDGGTGQGLRSGLGLEAQTKAEAIVVYPDAAGGSFDINTAGEGNKDLAFFDALTAKYTQSHCVSSVYAVGVSRGAYFANHLGCYRGDKLGALASHAGGGAYAAPYDSNGNLSCPSAPTASLIINGLADTEVPPSEGDKALAQWSRTLGCDGKTDDVSPDPCIEYEGCSKPLQSCQIPGLGHAVWEQGMAKTWSFFKAQ